MIYRCLARRHAGSSENHAGRNRHEEMLPRSDRARRKRLWFASECIFDSLHQRFTQGLEVRLLHLVTTTRATCEAEREREVPWWEYTRTGEERRKQASHEGAGGQDKAPEMGVGVGFPPRKASHHKRGPKRAGTMRRACVYIHMSQGRRAGNTRARRELSGANTKLNRTNISTRRQLAQSPRIAPLRRDGKARLGGAGGALMIMRCASLRFCVTEIDINFEMLHRQGVTHPSCEELFP